MPFILTIDEFLKKSISLSNLKYCEEEHRVLFLNEAIKNIDIKKLGISDNFTKFLKQSDYIYRFFLELASEKVEIEEIQNVDTYDFYLEHLEILKAIKKKYIEILENNSYVDKINLDKHYEINENFLDKFQDIELHFEGYFTKVEFEIVEKISQKIDTKIIFYSNSYNQKSLEVFKNLNINLKIDYKYKIDLTNKIIIDEEEIKSLLESYEIKGFSSRLNQIAYIKSCIEKSVLNGVNPKDIALVLPDESFVSSIELFDDERYFNYAMGKSIKNKELYQISNAIYLYLSEDEEKNISNISYLKIDKEFIDKSIKPFWNKVTNKELFVSITDFIKQKEKNIELIEKYDELLYKLNITLFSNENKILLKDVYKIFLQKLSSITLDDINSGKITVLGLLETRAVSFDTVIICDFNESYIPKISVKDKFLSTRLKQLANLPTQFDRESLQKYYYKRLMSSSKNVFISYVNSETNQISRFANELFEKNIVTDTNDSFYKHILYDNHKISYFDEDIISKIDLTKFIWSATSFKNFLECKRRFYLQYILKINEHTISLKPKGYELGDIIHSILEDYYSKDNKNSIEELFLKYKSSNPFLTLDLEVWKKKLLNFYEFDKQRLKNREIIMIEKEFNCSFNNINIKGIIDRVDKFEDNYEVIDYKTSSTLSVDTLKTYEKSVDFQLEFYHIALQQLFKNSNIKAFYYDLNECLLKEEVAIQEKLELLSSKFDELKELSKNEINFLKCEDKSNCLYCAYKIICNRE
ncbi:PD-(D/E)XK nuclease family protein [Aliarcobacter butzleri]|uniref:PD-(D/E)XK nuclease family protein n=1 Tax=Aliarcobacter butzleri TaxID=28197 RepID=UPI001D002671|nr:PD-(D/E)XK nuclease family protein [Aliarcobacter butzleri]MCT7549711.1 PD-(D/E)XK nuclease family protein [Aliarcobacter butzleri]MCT7558812.1 PD-(D/E)XK nuclease family protein [Aliarcobacter butzleri]MCT7626019.1 PD-(D/E)XK nuclease family protein [Aliarcobacter butzleri]MCT7637463.1 PD-(D/E)XK nuclease family protein [Aliarcobacter butzleri]MCT7642828.1 PD-(D/E)XK nuclease family protein [Aliarcobacter butzleri]